MFPFCPAEKGPDINSEGGCQSSWQQGNTVQEAFRVKLGRINTKQVDRNLRGKKCEICKSVSVEPFHASFLCVLWMQGNPTNLPGTELPSPEQHTRNSSLLQTASAAGQLRGQRRLPPPQNRFFYFFSFFSISVVDVAFSLFVCVCQSILTAVGHVEVECGALLNVRMSQRGSESPATRQTDYTTSLTWFFLDSSKVWKVTVTAS